MIKNFVVFLLFVISTSMLAQEQKKPPILVRQDMTEAFILMSERIAFLSERTAKFEQETHQLKQIVAKLEQENQQLKQEVQDLKKEWTQFKTSTLVVIDFENISHLVSVTNQYQPKGIIFSPIGNHGKTGDVRIPDFGVYDFGGKGPITLCVGGPGDKLSFHFILPDGSNGVTDYVQFRIGDGDPSAEIFQISFFGIDGTLLHQEQHTTYEGKEKGGMTIVYNSNGVHKVEIVTLPDQSGGSIDDIVFTFVYRFVLPK